MRYPSTISDLREMLESERLVYRTQMEDGIVAHFSNVSEFETFPFWQNSIRISATSPAARAAKTKPANRMIEATKTEADRRKLENILKAVWG
jgi:hypothetical protein